MSRRTSISLEHLTTPCLCRPSAPVSNDGKHKLDSVASRQSRNDDFSPTDASAPSSTYSLISDGSSSNPSTTTASSHPDRQQKMPNNTFYKRTLPSTCTPFNSPKGRSLFTGGLSEGYLETYFAL